MKAFNLKNDSYLVYYEDSTTQEVKLSDLENEVAMIKSFPVPSDAELLAWAKVNHPILADKNRMSTVLEEKENLITLIKAS